MKISVVIPTLHEEDHIGELLEMLAKQTVKPFEVLVVDGGSTDKTQKIVQKNKTAKLLVTKKGVGHQRHFGALKTTGDVIVFLDADAKPHKDFLKHIHYHFTTRNLDIACPLYLPHQSTTLISIIYMIFNLMFILFQSIAPSGAGSGFAVRKTIYDEVGGINKALTYDDIEFIRRAAKKRNFRMLPTFLHVSDRRFKKYGITNTAVFYLFLSFFFLFGLFKLANKIEYEFANYKK